MAHYLAAHPDIYMARKEMHVFGEDLHFGAKFYRRDLAAYLREFASCSGQRRAGEASVWYLFSKSAASEIRAFNPQSSIIVMLREPADMLYSLYHQFRFDGNEHLPSFEEALAADEDRRAGRRIGRQAYLPQTLVYRDVVRYAEQLRRYFDVFGRERVCVVLFDEFVSDPAAAARRTLEFLGVDATAFGNQCAIINSAKQVKSPALRAVLGDPWLRSAVLTLRPKLPRCVFGAFQRAESRLQKLNTRVEKPPPLSPETRALLQHEFAPEVDRLAELLNRDLGHWTRPDGTRANPSAHPALSTDEHTCLASSLP